MSKILVCRLADFENMGATGLLMGLIKSLRSYMPDVEIILLSSQPDKYREFAKKLGIELRPHPWAGAWKSGWLALASHTFLISFDFCRCFLCRLAGRLDKRVKTPYEQYDVVIDSNEDNLDEPAYGSRAIIMSLFPTLLEWAIFRRPMATTPTDVGPFTTRRTRWLARFVLNRVGVLALREEVSYDYCQQLGLSKPKICLTGEAAFLLEPAPQEKVELILQQEGITKIKGDKPFIGFSPNWLEMELFAFSNSISSEERAGKYVKLMAAMIDYIVDRLNATVCFIPHVTSGGSDDREVCYRIYEQVKSKQAVGVLRGKYLPDEIKGVIGSCDMFIGCRMHSAIAATSQGVPTVAIAYADKFYRIIGNTMGQEKYIVDIRTPSFDELLGELKLKLDSLWENRDKVATELTERAKIAQQQVLLYGKMVKELVECSKASV